MTRLTQLRRLSPSDWIALNPVLRSGEPGIETGTNYVKYGDGVTAWTSLPYASAGAGGGGGTVAGNALTANPLSQFAATSSLQLRGVISDETGTGALVFATSPTIVAPTISGVATIPGAQIVTPAVMAANVIDIASALNTKTVTGPVSYTFSAAPSIAGNSFGLELNVTTAAFVTLPPFMSGLTQGAARTSIFFPVGKWLLFFKFDGVNTYLYGEPGQTNNSTAAVNPALTDDSSKGYGPGSLWVNTTAHTAFVCETAGVGAAVWLAISGSTGSGGALGPYADLAATQAASPAATNAGATARIGTVAPFRLAQSDGKGWALQSDNSMFGLRFPVGGAQTLRTVLPKWSAAAIKARSGTHAIVAIIGDSTCAGFLSGYADGWRRGRSHIIAGVLDRAGLGGHNTSVFGTQAMENAGTSLPLYDLRVTFGGTWSTNDLGSFGRYAMANAAADTGVLSIQMTDVTDTLAVYYASQTLSNGNFTVNVGGAALGTFDCNLATGFRLGTMTHAPMVAKVNIQRGANAGNLYVIGVMAWNSRKPAVSVVNLSINGGPIVAMAGSTNPWNYVPAIATLAPALSYIEVQINDWVGLTAVAAYKSDMQALITSAKISGDVILGTGIPSNIASQTVANQQLYVTALYELADTNGLLLIDNYNVLGGTWVAANAAGYTSDNLHGNAESYARLGQNIGNVLVAGAGSSF